MIKGVWTFIKEEPLRAFVMAGLAVSAAGIFVNKIFNLGDASFWAVIGMIFVFLSVGLDGDDGYEPPYNSSP